MSRISSELIVIKLKIFYEYFLSQFRKKSFCKSLFINIKRLCFYLQNVKKFNQFGHLLTHFPLSESHKFKIKLSPLSNYLSRVFPLESVLLILFENYTFIEQQFSASTIEKIFCDGLECWRYDIYSIRLIKTKVDDYEGSFALIFNVNEKKIYTLAFSFAKSVIIPGQWAIYIARKQGERGMLLESKKTAKAFNDNKIITLVLAAVEGLALALDIRQIIGVGTINQLSNCKIEMRETFIHLYDDYWETQESIKLENGDYLLPVPMLFKPLDIIPAHHKKRTLIKRQRRQEISLAVRKLVESVMLIEIAGNKGHYPSIKVLKTISLFNEEESP